MRQKHPKYEIPTLTGLIASQKLRCDVFPVVGLGYVESRKHAVKHALSNPAYSKILFLDDDLLIPINVVETLSDYNMPLVSGIYLKRTKLIKV